MLSSIKIRMFLVIFIFLGFSILDYVNAHDNFPRHPLNEFSSHTIIKPQIHHGKHKRAIKSTLEEEIGLHVPHITLSYHNDGEIIVADLYLNHDLIPQRHFLRFQDKKNGGDIIKNFTKTELELCHYQGNIRGKPESNVAVSTCNNGINGVVFDGTTTYFIHSGPNGEIHSDHFLLKHDDFINNATCGYHNHHNDDDESIRTNGIYNSDDIVSNDDENNLLKSSEFNRILRYKRSNAEIRGPYNANKYSSFVELVLVVDNKVYQSFGENMKKIHNHCKDLANIVNALYVPLNIFIALVGVVVWNEGDEIALSEDGDTTLKNFLQYRRTKLVVNHPNDNAQLLTKVQFTGGVVGKALKGPICTFEYSGGVSMEHSSIVGVVATTVAHEMGHNFGMEHDTPDCKCDDEKCIMSASSTSVVPRHWSSCSKDQLNVAFSRGMNYCLRNKPTKLFDSPQCGNGFVEIGEQCDCGIPKYCQNTCCDPNTCMLYTNASCATGACCDLTTCRPKAAGIQCRSAQGECDLPEFCTGEAEFCPSDVFKRDTIECDGGNAYCYQGNCRSRTAQCKVLWGPSGQSSDYCYEKNTDGSRHGNCGFDRYNNKYVQCNKTDVYCGMLHCRHLNERLEFGMESVAVLSHSFMNYKSNIIPCRTAIVDLGLESIDPGLTPNGAKCGVEKMCVNQKCVDVKQFRATTGKGIGCPEDCNGNGACNSKGNCHCLVGFAPPYCSSPGPGGSEDSGPETNPNSRVGFTRAMYIFFLGVVPCVSIFLFLTYYYKQNNKSFTGLRKSANALKPTIKMSPSRGGNNGGGPQNSPSNGMPTSSPSSTDDMNSALLRSPTDTDTSIINNTMFGKFKGFTLRPLPNAAAAAPTGNSVTPNHEGPKVAFVHPVSKTTTIIDDSLNGVPIRAAPPKPNNIKQNGTLPHQKKIPPNTLIGGSGKHLTNGAPALPPPNPGFHARPLISNPVLEASTCSAKEVSAPMKFLSTEQNYSSNNNISIPVRPAPIAPPVPPHADIVQKRDGTIKRIASFLNKKDDKNSIHPTKVRPTIDRERLKTIEISGPLPVIDDTTTETTDNRVSMNRSQSMRSPSKTTNSVVNSSVAANNKNNLKSFASMRQPSGVNRPKSIVNNTIRPKSPPPRPPAPPINYKVPSSGQPNELIQNEYDDCEAIEMPLNDECSSSGGDEIYSVIDEHPPPPPQTVPFGINKKSIITKTTTAPSEQSLPTTNTDDSMGLLGEIVNEIEKRNGDSIYSASTLKNKKSTDNLTGTRYENTNDLNPDYGDVEYLKSNSSTSSTGYIRPSAINAPVARVAPSSKSVSKPTTSTANSNLSSTFSSFRPKNVDNNNRQINSNNSQQKVINSNQKTNPILGRTKTPPTLQSATTTNSVRKRSPSPANIHNKTTALNKNKLSPKSIRKNSIGDPKSTTTDSTNLVKKQLSGNLPQKPKPLSKPAVSNSTVLAKNLNSSTTGDKLRSTQQSVMNRKTSFNSDDSPIGNNSNLSNNSSNSNSKNLNAVVRPAGGKTSTVASLQQKFENNTTGGTNKTNFSNSLSGTNTKKI